jgi:hypothetical protein
MGVAFAPAGDIGYLSGGNDGSVVLFDLKSRRATGKVSVDGESVDVRIFDPQKALSLYDRTFEWRRVK